MYKTINQAVAIQAGKHLSRADSHLAKLVKQFGPCPIRPHQNYYQELVDSIISQQLSTKAAHAIERRFCELFGSSEFPSPKEILGKSIEELRGVGLSGAKAVYVQDLARHVLDGSIKFDHLDSLSNADVIAELTAVKGIGEWTAHMFLMFCVGRPDVLAHGDLGIRNGVKKLYELDHLPTPQEVQDICDKHNWHPYETIACWFIWESTDNVPEI